ncbi:MAG: hypothetical protein WAM77_23710, partial [Xanthobacteraceae bacterium]
MYASLTRAIEQAPLQNKLAVFDLMLGQAADQVASFVQVQVAALQLVAGSVGLIATIGTAAVESFIAAEFGGKTP